MALDEFLGRPARDYGSVGVNEDAMLPCEACRRPERLTNSGDFGSLHLGFDMLVVSPPDWWQPTNALEFGGKGWSLLRSFTA